MCSDPLVTAIIATYNRKHYVCDAIDSVLNQTYPNIEVIVIDDGSTDGTGDLLQARYGERIHYVYQVNKGRSEARNEGISIANGEYIAFLDSDDMWKPDKLLRQIRFMKQNPQFELTHTFIDNIRGKEGTLDSEYTAQSRRYYYQAIRRGYTYLGMSRRCTMFLSTVVMRKELIPRIGLIDPTFDAYEDWDWYLRASLVTQIGTLVEPLTWYRLHEGNSSTEQFNAGRIALAHKHLAQIDHVPSKMRRQANCNFYLQLATVAYYQEDKRRCSHWLLQAAKINSFSLLMPKNIPLLLTTLLPSSLVLNVRRFRRIIYRGKKLKRNSGLTGYDEEGQLSCYHFK